MVTRIKSFAIACLLVVLAGCGIDVKVAEPLATITPRPTYTDPVVWGGDVVRVQASSRFAFTEAEALAELFMTEQTDAYVLAGNTLYLPVYFNVVWYGSPQSTVQVTGTAYRRADVREAWTILDSDSRTLSTVNTPLLTEDGLGVGVLAADAGSFEVRMVVSAALRPVGGGVINRDGSNEFRVHVLTSPGDAPTDGDLSSPFGEMPTEALLFDYRGWVYGPCSVLEWLEDDGVRPHLIDACSAWEAKEVGTTIEALQAAAENASSDNGRAFASSMLGMLLVNQGDYDSGTLAFAAAAENFRLGDSAFNLTVAAHNLLTTYLMRDDRDAANGVLMALRELRGQFYDEIGEKLTQANIAYTDTDYEGMDDAYSYFNERDEPQAALIGLWLNR